jgi:tetratricopeptide (TPR) repeat protein
MSIKKASLIISLSLVATFCGAYENLKDAMDAARKATLAKNYSAAYAAYNEGLKFATRPVDKYQVIFRQAELYRTQRNFAQGEKLLQQIVNDSTMPANLKASACLTLAKFKESQKKFEEAVEAYQKSLQFVKDGLLAFEAYNKNATLLVRLKEYAYAIDCFNKALKVEIKDKRRSAHLKIGVYNNLSNTYVTIKQFEQAVKVLEDAAKLPEFSDKRNQKNLQNNINKTLETQVRNAIIYKKFDQADKAMKVIKAKGNFPKVENLEAALLTAKAAFAKRTRKNDEAEKYLKEILTIKGVSSGAKLTAYSELVSIYAITNRPQEVAKTLQLIDKVKLTDPEEYFSKAYIKHRYFISVKKYADAVKVLDDTAKIKNLRPYRVARCYELLAHFYVSQKDFDKAKSYYLKALKTPKANFKNPILKKRLGL